MYEIADPTATAGGVEEAKAVQAQTHEHLEQASQDGLR
jgi:hypothetical protein